MVILKKDMIFAILAAFCLTSILFLTVPIRSTTTPGEYDPWIDTNDDGIIDYQDLFNLASMYRTSGTPINKTDLLLNLQARVDSLNASVIELQSAKETLEARVTTLEGNVAALETDVDELETTTDTLNAMVLNLVSRVEVLEVQTGLPPPDYDSEWVSKDLGGTQFVHNLGTTEVLVYVVGRHPSPEIGIHQNTYGGDYYYIGTTTHKGLFWSNLTPTTIWVVRNLDDVTWSEVRVMMWKIRQPPS